MLELPESYTIAKQMNEELKGATYHGGIIELHTEESMLIFSDGANVRYYEDKSKFPKKHQLAIYFDEAHTVPFVRLK